MSACIGSQTAARVADCMLESLAPELLLGIVRRLPDLISLDCLLRASPAVLRLFDQYAVEITEAVLSSGFTHRHIQVIIRIVALIRSSALPIKNLANFKSYITHEAMYRRVRKSSTGLAPERLSETTRPAILRSILATNRLITCYAFDCIEHYLIRFRALKPKHPTIDVTCRNRASRAKFRRDGLLVVDSGDFNARDFGPPSWVRIYISSTRFPLQYSPEPRAVGAQTTDKRTRSIIGMSPTETAPSSQPPLSTGHCANPTIAGRTTCYPRLLAFASLLRSQGSNNSCDASLARERHRMAHS